MKRKKKSGGGGANWMDTYGDMVTLLLCFFVLLYSISSTDQEKWIQLIQALNPQAVTSEEATYPDITDPGNQQSSTNLIGTGVPPAVETEESDGDHKLTVNEVLDQLYLSIQSYLESNPAAESTITATKGNGYVFLMFDDAVFFDGDSYVIRAEGKQILDDVSVMLNQAADVIDQIEVLGHTSQSRSDAPNIVSADRFLSSNRATVVLVYLQERLNIDPARLVSLGYGQWRPITSNDNETDRSKNRRVEIMITGCDLEDTMRDSITQYYTERSGGANVTADGAVSP